MTTSRLPSLRRDFPGETVVIVGAGQAGAQAAASLREGGFTGRIVLIGDEPCLPYMRPPLSKKYLSGELDEERTFLRPATFYSTAGIDTRIGVRVEGIDRAAHELRLAGGERLAYDKLLLATGSRPRQLDVAGAALAGVHALRTLEDSQRLRTAIAAGRPIVIVGGGYLGLEVAATAASAGASVTVVEQADRLLARVTTASIAGFLEGAHRSHGVDIHCATRVLRFHGTDRLEAVETDRGTFPAAVAVVGIGAIPNVGLAYEAGLVCDDGIVVDDCARTSDPAIYAAGDCTRHPNAIYGRRLRLESVQNAVDQAGVAARNIAGGAAHYHRVPWFWSHQYDYRLQSAGLADGHDEVEELGDRAAGRFALVYSRRGKRIAVDAVNLPGEYLRVRREIEQREHGPSAPAEPAPRRQAA